MSEPKSQTLKHRNIGIDYQRTKTNTISFHPAPTSIKTVFPRITPAWNNLPLPVVTASSPSSNPLLIYPTSRTILGLSAIVSHN